MLTVKQWKDAFDSDSEYSNEIVPPKPEVGDADSGKANNPDSMEEKKKETAAAK
jgi:hypothetical protein